MTELLKTKSSYLEYGRCTVFLDFFVGTRQKFDQIADHSLRLNGKLIVFLGIKRNNINKIINLLL
jgi:hypothetical protein